MTKKSFKINVALEEEYQKAVDILVEDTPFYFMSKKSRGRLFELIFKSYLTTIITKGDAVFKESTRIKLKENGYTAEKLKAFNDAVNNGSILNNLSSLIEDIESYHDLKEKNEKLREMNARLINDNKELLAKSKEKENKVVNFEKKIERYEKNVVIRDISVEEYIRQSNGISSIVIYDMKDKDNQKEYHLNQVIKDIEVQKEELANHIDNAVENFEKDNAGKSFGVVRKTIDKIIKTMKAELKYDEKEERLRLYVAVKDITEYKRQIEDVEREKQEREQNIEETANTLKTSENSKKEYEKKVIFVDENEEEIDVIEDMSENDEEDIKYVIDYLLSESAYVIEGEFNISYEAAEKIIEEDFKEEILKIMFDESGNFIEEDKSVKFYL